MRSISYPTHQLELLVRSFIGEKLLQEPHTFYRKQIRNYVLSVVRF
jgi:hypothetical protein